MEEFLLDLITSMSGPYGYGLLAVSAFFENVLPPVPGDTVTVFGGYLVGSGRMSLAGAVLATTAGSFAGFMAMYAAGRFLGHELLRHGSRIFARETIDRVHRWFERYGVGVVLANRFLSGARSVISICAGIARLSPWLVGALCLVSCLAWNWLLIFAGSKVGENWALIIDLLKKYNAVVAVALGLVAAVWVARRIMQRRAARNPRTKKY